MQEETEHKKEGKDVKLELILRDEMKCEWLINK